MKSTFPFISAHLPRFGLRGEGQRVRRGFTLLELMVVVLVISISAAIAMPGIVKRMKSNETKIAAEKISLVYRQARLRAMGRSAATLVRYNNGVVSVREAIQGTSATATGCARLPDSSCLLPTDRWDGTARSQQVSSKNFLVDGTMELTLTEHDGTISTAYDVCFTPTGRAFQRRVFADPLTPMLGPMRIDVERADNVGFQRSILISPTGATRVVAAP